MVYGKTQSAQSQRRTVVIASAKVRPRLPVQSLVPVRWAGTNPEVCCFPTSSLVHFFCSRLARSPGGPSAAEKGNTPWYPRLRTCLKLKMG